MSFMKSLVAAPTIAMFLSGAAHAALTANGVWETWKANGLAAGLTVTAATENSAGGVLTLNGVSVALGDLTVLTVSDLVLTEKTDGSVAVVPGNEVGLLQPGLIPGTLALTHEGLEITVTAAAEDLAYSYSAAKLNLAYDITVEPESGAEGEVALAGSGTFGFENMSGTYSNQSGANRALALDIAAERMVSTSRSSDPYAGEQTAEQQATDVTFALGVTLPSEISVFEIDTPVKFGTALAQGLAVTVSSTSAETSGTMKQESDYFPLSLLISSVNAEVALSLSKDKFAALSSVESFVIESGSEMMPTPLTISSGPMEFAAFSPMVAPEPQDYGVVLKFDDLSLNDAAWSMLDPTGALPRDAADLVIDISGKMALDLIAMLQAEEAGQIPPSPVMESMDINEVSASVVGAALLATGAFTFDNSTMAAMPLGEATVTITGATKLIDGLVAAGLLTEEDVAGILLTIGMFTVPGENPDELVSKIEAKEGFQVLVNGQPMPM